jgi:5'-nucleotidase
MLWSERTLLSINIPDCEVHDLGDVHAAEQGIRRGCDAVEARLDPRGRSYYWIGSTDYSDCIHQATTDCAMVQQNHIAVTPVSLNLTDHAMLELMKQHFSRIHNVAA